MHAGLLLINNDFNFLVLFQQGLHFRVAFSANGDGLDAPRLVSLHDLKLEYRLTHQIHAYSVGLGLYDNNILSLQIDF